MYEKEMERLRELYDAGTFRPAFYASRIKDGTEFQSYEKFATIPFSYKEELRTTSAFARTTTPFDQIYGIFSSSGTTGKKTYYLYSKKDKQVHEEFVKTFYTELGIRPDDLGAVCAPIDTGVMAHTMMWQFTTMGAGYVNCPEPSPENMAELITSLPVTVVATRPDVVSRMAFRPEWTQAAQMSKVRTLLLGGGFLSKQRRKLLERVWSANVYNMFGMSEMFGPMAGECRLKNGQHYLNRYLFIELINPDTLKPVESGQEGIAVYTTLWDKGFPLLRYWTDDLMRIETAPCACGSSLPRIFYCGRMGDCLRVRERVVFPADLEEILINYGFVMDYQAVMRDGTVTVTIEKPESQSPSEIMETEIRALFGGNASILYVSDGALRYPGHGKRFFQDT